MNGPALKIVPQVNLDEFERRLRAAGAPAGAQEDPLHELARLVGLDATAGKPAGDPVAAAPAPPPPPARLPHIDEHINDADGFDRLLRVDFGAPQPAAQIAPSPEPVGDEAPVSDVEPLVEAPPVAAARPDAAQWAVDSPPPRRSGRAKLAVGVLVGLGAAGLVGAWAVKGAPGLPKTPPLILAVDGPIKVQPPSQETVASANDSASVLLKDQTGKSASVKLVSNEEQPVDLQQQAPAAAPSDAAAAPAPAAPAQQGAERSIASLATVAATAAPPAAPAPFPEPKRVKTVSVRPDGSLIANAAVQTADAGPAIASQDIRPAAAVADPAPPSQASPAAPPPAADASPAAPAPVVAAPAAAPATAKTPVDAAPTATATSAADSSGDLAQPRPSDVPVPKARPSFGALAQPATPKLDLPAKPAAKSTARVPIAKIDTTVAGGSTPTPDSPLQIVPSLLGSVARAVGGQPATQVAAADPVATPDTAASPAAPAPASRSDGSYAVQLGAPGSEQEAQSMSTRLRTKFTAQLDGMQPSIHQADVNGRSIYRIRVSGLSKTDAVALCLKLKAAGGDGACFVAKN